MTRDVCTNKVVIDIDVQERDKELTLIVNKIFASTVDHDVYDIEANVMISPTNLTRQWPWRPWKSFRWFKQ